MEHSRTYTDAPIEYQENPRQESKENKLFVKNEGLKSLGFDPILLSDKLLEDIIFLAKQYSSSVNPNIIKSNAKWSNLK
jgi:UDP-sulfoquinovose synthase